MTGSEPEREPDGADAQRRATVRARVIGKLLAEQAVGVGEAFSSRVPCAADRNSR